MSEEQPIQKKWAERLGKIGFVQERKALALSLLGIFTSYFLLLVLAVRTEMPEWLPAFAALFAMYFIAFFSVAAHWFWGRWIAIGVGSWGATIAAWGIVQMRELSGPLVFIGITHGLVALLLMGESMGTLFEGRTDWRARFGLDEEGVQRLRKTVTRSASSVPALVLFVLAPRQDDAALIALFAVLGIGALLAGRTMGLAGLLVAAAGMAGVTIFGSVPSVDTHGLFIATPVPQFLGAYASVALFAALAPFVGPIGRYLKK
jgi:hypothetical protein